jgi:hypothetical protein
MRISGTVSSLHGRKKNNSKFAPDFLHVTLKIVHPVKQRAFCTKDNGLTNDRPEKYGNETYEQQLSTQFFGLVRAAKFGLMH